MKISDIKTTFLNLPHREPEFVSTGYRLGTTEILIEVETDEGITGLGECICRPNSQVIEAAILSAKPFLLGRDPRNIERILNDLKSLGNWSFFERVGNVMMGGVETALWDIMGKVSGQPLYYLLGGLLRERIPIFYYLLRFPLDEMVRRARQAVSEGYQTIFFKGIMYKSDETLALNPSSPAVQSTQHQRVGTWLGTTHRRNSPV